MSEIELDRLIRAAAKRLLKRPPNTRGPYETPNVMLRTALKDTEGNT